MVVYMDKLEFIIKEIEKNGGIIKTAQLNKLGIRNDEIVQYCNDSKIERIKHGYYVVPDNYELSEERMIVEFLDEGIVCMESALFFYGYSDKSPLEWTIAVPRNISKSKLKIDNFIYRPYFVQEDKFNIGITKEIINGIEMNIYDRERTICDCFKYKTKMDREMFLIAIKSYVEDSKKNISNLALYAKKLRVYKKVMETMEVLLNA